MSEKTPPDTGGDATRRLAQRAGAVGLAERLLTADELEELKHQPAEDCDRCHAEFGPDRHLLTLTGHYNSGADYEICLACTESFLRWLRQEPDAPPYDPANPGHAPSRWPRHQ